MATLVDLPIARWLAKPRQITNVGIESDGDTNGFAGDTQGSAGRRSAGSQRLPGDLLRLLNLSEVFGYSPTACIILLAALLLDSSLVRQATGSGLESPSSGPRRAWCLPVSLSPEAVRMLAASFSGGLTTDLVKLVVTRVRPYAADLAGHASAVDTFSNIERVGGAAMRSFPSGHAAVAAGLASALSWRYPRGTPLFVVLAICAATQRLTSGSHYASDVFAGAAIAIAWAAFWLPSDERANPG